MQLIVLSLALTSIAVVDDQAQKLVDTIDSLRWRSTLAWMRKTSRSTSERVSQLQRAGANGAINMIDKRGLSPQGRSRS